MAKLSKRDTAKCLNVSRSTLYRWITEGRIPVDPEGKIDTTDLLSRGFLLHASDTSDMSHPVPIGHFETPDPVGQQRVSSDTLGVSSDSPSVPTLQKLVDTLERELADAKAEKARLLAIIEGQQRLLEAAKPPPLWPRLKLWLVQVIPKT